MRVAALYDIHGNLPALDAVLSDVREERVDLIVVGGDVFPGPMASEVLDRLSTCGIPHRAVRGNGERAVLEQLDGRTSDALQPELRAIIEWHASHLDPRHVQMLREWPASLRLDVPGLGRALFVHATPTSDTDIFTERTSDDVVRRVFSAADADVVVCGHTHMQFERALDGLRVINAGSVGMPFEEPGAYWALLGPDVTLRHTSYDRAAAAATIRRAAYPTAADFAERYVLNPPTRAATLDLFARVELR
jgi:predicted phosphodiesterase